MFISFRQNFGAMARCGINFSFFCVFWEVLETDFSHVYSGRARKKVNFFFCNIGSFHPPCVRFPLDTLESGVLFHIMVVETVICFTRRSTMESSVVSSLPDCAFTPTLESTGWSNQL